MMALTRLWRCGVAGVALLLLLLCVHALQVDALTAADDAEYNLLRLNGGRGRDKACHIYRYDLSYINSMSRQDAYEHAHLVAALQGLVNREYALLYAELIDIDSDWLNFLTSKGEWMEDCNVTTVTSIGTLLSTFRAYYRGVVLYDPNVASTSLVASTIAGADSLLPICQRDAPGSLYRSLVLGGPRLQVVISLVNRFDGKITGSKKCDAYLWAVDNYLSTGKSNASLMGYYIDYFWTEVTSDLPYSVNTVTNHDFIISRKGFFWDLDVWPTDEPNDDPHQPLGTDYRTLNTILLTAYNLIQNRNMIHIAGFTPWAFKYITPQHGGVDTEWQTAKILSSYNAFIDADACCVNSMTSASFFQHYPLRRRHVQNPVPTNQDLIRAGYLSADGRTVIPRTYFMFYAGDYDSAAWLYSQLKPKWDDPNRGAVPVGWAIDPNLSQRFPVIFDYMFRSLKPKDRIITGDSGPGYINPTQLFVPRQISGLPSGENVWIAHAQPYYKQFDITFTGFLINGAAGPMTNAAERLYSNYLSPDGMVEQTGYGPGGEGIHLQGRTPVFYEWDIPGDVTQAIATIKSFYKPGKLDFQVYRAILQSPTYFKQVVEGLRGLDIAVVEPLVLAALAKIHLSSTASSQNVTTA